MREFKPLFDTMLLAENEVGLMYKLFRRVDEDNSGTVDLLELLMYLDIERTPFNLRAFSVFDEDSSGCVDFREFVISLW
jgi:Ca2+-binding EF-hand superfamily protein